MLQDRFIIEGLIGKGGMASVYLARHKVLAERLVAVKEMALAIVDPGRLEKATAQFASEARLLASLDHPGLVKVIDYFKTPEAQYLVMEYIEGRTLDAMLPMAPNFIELSAVLEWADQVCQVLTFLHSRKPPVLFRDLKPGNIMLDKAGKLRLIDFGIARTLQEDENTATYIKGAGSLGYAPPEQFEDHTDIRSDIYSLGATLYCLLTNVPPPASLVRAKAKDTLVPPRYVNTAVPPTVNATILHMLALNPADRPQSIGEVQKALHERSKAVDTPSRPRWVFEEGPTTVTMRTTLTPSKGSPTPSPGAGRAGWLWTVLGMAVGGAVLWGLVHIFMH